MLSPVLQLFCNCPPPDILVMHLVENDLGTNMVKDFNLRWVDASHYCSDVLEFLLDVLQLRIWKNPRDPNIWTGPVQKWMRWWIAVWLVAVWSVCALDNFLFKLLWEMAFFCLMKFTTFPWRISNTAWCMLTVVSERLGLTRLLLWKLVYSEFYLVWRNVSHLEASLDSLYLLPPCLWAQVGSEKVQDPSKYLKSYDLIKNALHLNILHVIGDRTTSSLQSFLSVCL